MIYKSVNLNYTYENILFIYVSVPIRAIGNLGAYAILPSFAYIYHLINRSLSSHSNLDYRTSIYKLIQSKGIHSSKKAKKQKQKTVVESVIRTNLRGNTDEAIVKFAVCDPALLWFNTCRKTDHSLGLRMTAINEKSANAEK